MVCREEITRMWKISLRGFWHRSSTCPLWGRETADSKYSIWGIRSLCGWENWSNCWRKPPDAEPSVSNFLNSRATSQSLGLGNIRPSDWDVARLFRKLLTDGSASGGFLQQFDQFSQPHRLRIPQIEYFESAVSRPQSGHVLDRCQNPRNDIFHIRVISSRQTIPEDGQRALGFKQSSKFVDRQVRPLPRAVHREET